MKLNKILFILLVLGVGICFATTSQHLPWDDPLDVIKKSLTGTVATAISLMAIVGAGVALVFGGEFSGFVKSIIYTVLVIALIIGANKVLSLFQGAGLLI